MTPRPWILILRTERRLAGRHGGRRHEAQDLDSAVAPGLLGVGLLTVACSGSPDTVAAKKPSRVAEPTTTTSSTETTLATGERTTTGAVTTTTAKKVVANASATRNQASLGQTRQLSSGPATTAAPEFNVPPADWNPDGALRIAYAVASSTFDPAGNVIHGTQARRAGRRHRRHLGSEPDRQQLLLRCLQPAPGS